MPTKKKSKNPLRKINLSSRKFQVLATVLVFAIVGGGILIYKSFAASSNQSWGYSISNGGVQVTGAFSCTTETPFTDSQKSNFMVYKVAFKAGCKTGGIQPWIATNTTGPTAPIIGGTNVNNWYRFCAYVKAGSANTPVTIRYDDLIYPKIYSVLTYNNISTTTYNEPCTGWLYENNPTYIRGEVIMNANPASRVWYVGSITLQQSTTNPNASQNPSPAK